MNPLTAVQHAAPWRYYARLTRDTPLYFDRALGLWVVSSAAITEAVLDNPVLQVRPAKQPVPPGLVGQPAGDVFHQLVRMREGDDQRQLKAIVIQALATALPARVSELARRLAQQALNDGVAIDRWLFRVPAATVATLCGVMPQDIPAIVALIAEFVLCLPAAASREHQQRASAVFRPNRAGAARQPVNRAVAQRRRGRLVTAGAAGGQRDRFFIPNL